MPTLYDVARPQAWVIAIGEEILRGELVDTNTAFLAKHLERLGFSVRRHIVAGDAREELVEILRDAAGRARVVMCTGGLGPTGDDLTAACAAEAFGRRMVLDEEARRMVTERIAVYGLKPDAANLKQAEIPEEACIIPNPLGTAPGIELREGECTLFFFPGVPREMKPMFEETVRTRLAAISGIPETRESIRLSFFGIGESRVAKAVADLESSYPNIAFRYRFTFPCNHLTLQATDDEAAGKLGQVVESIEERLRKYLFSRNGKSHPEAVLDLLRSHNATLSTAESCTGGWIAKLVTDIPGSSDVFREGVVTYSNEAKIRLLGVPSALVEEHGAVSEPVVRAMAEGMRNLAGTTYAVAVSGVAGPGGGSEEKPVGTVWLAMTHPGGIYSTLRRFPGSREAVRLLSAHAALELVRRHLAGFLEDA